MRRPPANRLKRLVQAGSDFLYREQVHTRCRQLDCQGDTVQAHADLGNLGSLIHLHPVGNLSRTSAAR